MPLVYIILTAFILALISLSAVFTLLLGEKKFKQILLPMVAFSAGGLLGGAFFHLIPEAVDVMGNGLVTYIWIAIGFVTFFILEQFIHFHHCHNERPEHVEAYSYLAIISDNLHNFLDGVTVATAFVVDIRLGVATAVAVLIHEVPHELGNFSVLVHGGFTKVKALFLNAISSFSFLVGGLLTYFVASKIDVSFLLAFAAGNFLYIAASNLVPEIHKDCHFIKKNLVHFIAFLLGLALLLLAKIYFAE